MAATGTITHPAKVTRVLTGAVEVEIQAEGACAACRAKKQCGMGEGGEKCMIVHTPDAACYEVGENVTVTTGQTMGVKAIVLAYVIPLLSVMAMLLTLLQTGCGELLSGLSALGILTVYYPILYLCRNRIAREITFNVYKTE